MEYIRFVLLSSCFSWHNMFFNFRSFYRLLANALNPCTAENKWIIRFFKWMQTSCYCYCLQKISPNNNYCAWWWLNRSNSRNRLFMSAQTKIAKTHTNRNSFLVEHSFSMSRRLRSLVWCILLNRLHFKWIWTFCSEMRATEMSVSNCVHQLIILNLLNEFDGHFADKLYLKTNCCHITSAHFRIHLTCSFHRIDNSLFQTVDSIKSK